MKLRKILLFSVISLFLTINLHATTISEIQGSGAISPLEGQRVTTEGNIVTFVMGSGFFIQAPANLEDGNPETSEGVYVYSNNSGVSVGDIVNITADVSEFYYLTELGNANVTVISSGNPLPEPILFGDGIPSKTPLGNVSELERYEGMLVKFSDGIVTGSPDSYDTMYVNPYGERTFHESGIIYPGMENLPVWDGNPEVIGTDLSDTAYAGLFLPSGTKVNNLEGPLTYAYGLYTILPKSVTYTENSNYPRPVRTPNSNEITIGTQNMLNLSMTETDNRFSKLSLQVRENLKAPDILAVQEVFDINALQKLADKIHSDDNSITYSAYLIEGESNGIDSGFLVKGNVTVNNVYQIFKDEEIQSGSSYYPLHDRPPLVMECSVLNGTNSIDLTVICVHNRSLNDVDTKDFVREKRFRQAEDIAEYVDSLLDADPGKNIIVTGDFNCYQFTDGYVDGLGMITGNLDPQGAMLEGEDLVDIDLRNQIYSLPFEERYSYVHEGNSSALDHMLTSFNLNKYVVEINYARGNADVSESYEDVSGTALRSSDHDGLVMFLKLEPDEGFENVVPLSNLITNSFSEDTICYNYFTNTSGESGTISLTELDPEGVVLNELEETLTSGEKIELSSLLVNSNLSNLIITSEKEGALFSEVVANTGQMTSYMNQNQVQKRYIPHIAEQVDQWDSFIFLSCPEKMDVTIDVAENSGTYENNYSFFDNCEQYLDTTSGSISSDTSYGTLNSVSNKITGFEIFKKDGNDGAATELVAEGSKTLFIPHIPTETDIFWTGLSFLNSSDVEINSKITLFDNNGNITYSHPFKVSANTKIVGVLFGENGTLFPDVPITSEWGIVESDGKLIGLEIYGTYQAGICGFSLTGESLTDGILPLIYKGEGLWTGIAFANPDIETALVTVRLYSKDGAKKEEKQFSIDSKKRYAFVVDSLFSANQIESTDYVTFYSEKPVVAIEASGDLDRTFMTALGSKSFKY